MAYIKYDPEEEMIIATIYLETNEVQDQMSVHNKSWGIHSLNLHNLLKRVSLRVVYGNGIEKHIRICL